MQAPKGIFAPEEYTKNTPKNPITVYCLFEITTRVVIRKSHVFLFLFQTLRKFGASGVYVLATHGLFSGASIETILLNTDLIRKIVVTNTVPQVTNRTKMPDILQVIDISGNSTKIFFPKKVPKKLIFQD